VLGVKERVTSTVTKPTQRKDNPVTTETLIYGLPKGETGRYAEVLLYGGGRKLSEDDVRKVLAAASKDGFHSFRVTGFKAGTFPDFGSAVLRKANPVKTTTKRKPNGRI
jgi:hypothetical protein